MLTPDESRVAASAVTDHPPRKLRELLHKRLRQLLRVACILAICLALAAGALAIRWLTCLNGLPDIGDPFDGEATRDLKIADDQNALHFLLRAQEKLIPLPEVSQNILSEAQTVEWSQADPKLSAWVTANLPALELFEQGADQSDGFWRPASQLYWQNYPLQGPNSLMTVALLEGSRRRESGNMAGAWKCYRAVLRMTTHIRRRGELGWRASANTVQSALRERLLTWSTDPRTTIPQLREALQEAIERRPRPEWDVSTLRIEYLDLMRSLEGPGHPRAFEPGVEAIYRLGDLQLPREMAVLFYELKRWFSREPELSRRVTRLIFANWLARAQEPDSGQRKPALRARFQVSDRTSSVLIYAVSPQSPANAQVLAPRDVSRWLFKTYDARHFFEQSYLPGVRMAEERGYRDLLILLATELYRRERGRRPASDEALVGTYLKSLPGDGTIDLDDGTIPTISEHDDSAQIWPE